MALDSRPDGSCAGGIAGGAGGAAYHRKPAESTAGTPDTTCPSEAGSHSRSGGNNGTGNGFANGCGRTVRRGVGFAGAEHYDGDSGSEDYDGRGRRSGARGTQRARRHLGEMPCYGHDRLSLKRVIVHATWLVGGLLLAAAGAWWGIEVGAARQLEELETKLKRLEEWRDHQLAMPACITDVRRAAEGWRLLRADNSEAGSIEATSCASAEAAAEATRRATEAAVHAAGQCVVDVAVDEGGGALHFRRVNGEAIHVALHRTASITTKTASSSTQPSAPPLVSAKAPLPTAEELPSLPLQRSAQQWSSTRPPAVERHTHVAEHVVAPPSTRQVENYAWDAGAFSELTCWDPSIFQWHEVKIIVAQHFGNTWEVGVFPKDPTLAQAVLDASVERLQSASHLSARTCGIGRLCLSLLSALAVAAVPDEGVVGGTAGVAKPLVALAPELHAPMLTMLLQVSWGQIVRSGWPIFSLLSQIQLRMQGRTAFANVATSVSGGLIAGVSSPEQAEYLGALRRGLEQQWVSGLAGLGEDFLRREEQRVIAGTNVDGTGHVMPGICALASQLLSSEVVAGESADEALTQVQGFFRQAVQSIDDLMATLTSAWPLYSVLHVAALRLV